MPARAQTPAAQGVPDGVVLLAELKDVQELDSRMAVLATKILPERPYEPLSDELPDALKTTDATTIDLTKPLHVVGLAPPLLESLVLVFSVTDAERYMDSISPDFEEVRQEEGLHLYEDVFLGFEEEEGWEQEEAVALAIGIVDGRAAIGDDPEAVRTVMELLQDGALPAEPFFADSHAGAVVRLKQMLEGLTAKGSNPFDMMRAMGAVAMGMGPQQPGMDPQKMVGTLADGVESLAMQVETVSGGLSLGEDDVSGYALIEAVPDGTVATYIAQMKGGELATAKHMPSGVIGAAAFRIGDLGPLVSWYGKFMEALVPSEGAEAVDALAQMMEEGLGLVGDETAMAFDVGAEGHFAVISASKVKDAGQTREFLASAADKLELIGRMQQAFGVQSSVKYTPAVETHAGHEIDRWTYDWEFPVMPGPQGEQMAAMQRGMITAFWGEQLEGYGTFVDDVYLYTQGSGALERLKAAIDGAPSSAAELMQIAGDLAGRTDSPAAVGYLSLERMTQFYMGAMGKAMAGAGGMGMPPMFQNLQFEVGDPVGWAAWVNDDGTLEKRFRMPVSAVANVKNGFQQAMMGAMQPVGPMEEGGQDPFMQP
jgi:hypothetical protein